MLLAAALSPRSLTDRPLIFTVHSPPLSTTTTTTSPPPLVTAAVSLAESVTRCSVTVRLDKRPNNVGRTKLKELCLKTFQIIHCIYTVTLAVVFLLLPADY